MKATEGRDPIGAILRSVAVNASLCSEAELRAPWGISFPPFPGQIMFHLVVEGRMWLVKDGEGQWIESGEFVLLPHGEGHSIYSHPKALAVDLFQTKRRYLNDRYEILHHGEDGAITRTFCGLANLANPISHRFARSLPGIVHLPTANQATNLLIDLIFAESREERAGSLEIVAKLIDALILKALQGCVLDSPRSGWLGALTHDRIGPALAALHQAPQESWTVERLAQVAGMSRSGFSTHFTRLVGEPPMAYLVRWRMEMATERLIAGDKTLEAISQELGYESAAAFSHAFKRIFGVSPGAYRKLHAT